MAEYYLDSVPYHLILYAILRHEDCDPERIPDAVAWVEDKSALLRRICSPGEWALLASYLKFWKKHQEAPDRKLLETIVRDGGTFSDEQMAVLEDFDKHEADLTLLDTIALNHQLDNRREEWEKFKLTSVLNKAVQITSGSQPVKDKKGKQITYTGPSGALAYIHQRVQEGILLDDMPTQGGLLADTVDHIKPRYDRTVAERLSGELFIKTGMSFIDNHLGGLRRKEVSGVLGFVGQKKSGFIRTVGFNAAINKFRVLHIPLESDYEEEETCYTVLSAPTLAEAEKITKPLIERGLLSKSQEAAYFDAVLPWYRKFVAEYVSVYEPGGTRSWPDIRAIIERETAREPIDLVIIDYLTMCSTPGARDDVADKTAIFQDAKQLAMTANDGRGLSMLTPIQGNRAGWIEATNNKGAWSLSGIHKYSEIEKSLDNIFHVYFNDEMAAQNEIFVGSCKLRRALNIPVTKIPLHPDSGQFDRLNSNSGLSEVELKNLSDKDRAQAREVQLKNAEFIASYNSNPQSDPFGL